MQSVHALWHTIDPNPPIPPEQPLLPVPPHGTLIEVPRHFPKTRFPYGPQILNKVNISQHMVRQTEFASIGRNTVTCPTLNFVDLICIDHAP